jgi:hypothetical protein
VRRQDYDKGRAEADLYGITTKKSKNNNDNGKCNGKDDSRFLRRASR